MAEATRARDFKATQVDLALAFRMIMDAKDALPKEGAEYYHVRIGHVAAECEKVIRELSHHYGAPVTAESAEG